MFHHLLSTVIMKLNRKKLLEALQIVSPGLSKREFIDQATFFAFVVDKVVTYNDSISVSHPVEGLDLDGAVIAEEFQKMLNKYKTDEVELIVEGPELKVSSGKANTWIKFDETVKLPLDELTKSKWQPLDAEIIKAIKFVAPVCGKDNMKPLLTAVHVSNKGFVEASDSYRIVRYNVPKFASESFLLPKEAVNHVCGINPIKISKGNGWIHFKNGNGTVLSTRTFDDDKYPDTSRFLSVKGQTIKLPEVISEILERAVVIDKELIDIHIINDYLKVSSKSDNGKFHEEAEMLGFTGEVTFKINPTFFKSVLSETLECSISNNLIIFETDKWKNVTLLSV